LHAFRRGLTALTAIALAVIVAACGTGTQAGGPSSGADTIAFASPGDGSTVGIPFDVTLESSVALGEPETGNHHAHIYFDTDTSSADYDIVYGNSWQVTRQLAAGEHTLTVALANPDHSLAGPTGTITIQVGDAAGGGDASPPAPTEALPGY
jgi:hypothetical protein